MQILNTNFNDHKIISAGDMNINVLADIFTITESYLNTIYRYTVMLQTLRPTRVTPHSAKVIGHYLVNDISLIKVMTDG